MSSKYEKYNQAIAQEEQLQTIENEIKPQVQEQLEEVESSETSYNKDLRSAVISNQEVDLNKASKTKKEFIKIKNEVKEPLRQIEVEKNKINNLKSGIKTPEQLEAQGYKKEVRGGQVTYYKEDTYRKRKGDDRRTYREEEFIFKSDGTPVRFVERDDYRDGDRRRVDEEKIVSFDSQGRVSQVRTYNDGKKDEKISYRFNSDGSMSVKTRDYAKERRLEAKAQKLQDKQLAEQRKVKNVTASLDIYGNSKYTETKFNEKSGQWEKTTTTYTKQNKIPTKRVPKTKVLQATKTPIIETQLSQNLNLDAGIPGINQGTNSNNIPKYDPYGPKPGEATMSAPTQNVKNIMVEKQRQEEYEKANPVKKFFMKDWSQESLNQRNKFDKSGGTDVQAVTYEIGAGAISALQGTGQFVRAALTTNPITTATNIITAIPEIPGAIKRKAQTNPGGLVGEIIVEVATGSLVGKVVSKARYARQTVKQSEITDVSTRVVDDVIETSASGSYQVERGLVWRKTDDYTFESTGKLEKVKSHEVPGETPNNFKTISETKIEKLSDKPSSKSKTQKQITQQSSSTDITNPKIKAETKGIKEINENIVETQSSKEIFRGEIETQIKDSKGNVVETQKVSAELVKDGQKQTLFVDGKPFDIKSQRIPTKESVAIDGDIAMSEGEYGLNLKKDTIETITTDLETGVKRKTLTQELDDMSQSNFNMNEKSKTSQKKLSNKKQNLLSDKAQTPIEFVESPGGALTDPIISAKKKKKTNSNNVKGVDSKNEQIFEGVSISMNDEPLKITKEASATILDGEITGEKLTPKKIGFEQSKLTGQKVSRLESPGLSEERQVAEVFGQDFVDNAKKTKTINLDQDPFSNSDMFKSSMDEVQGFEQVFKQETKTKMKTELESKKSQTPNSKTTTQEMIFDQKPQSKSSPTKELNIDDISLDVSVGADFSKIGSKSKGAKPWMMPSFNESQGFEQGSLFGQMSGQQTSQSQGQVQTPGFDQGFKTEVATDKIFKNEQTTKQAQDQQTGQNLIQGNDLTSPGVPPIAPPGFNPTSTPIPRLNKKKNFNDPFNLNRRKNKHQGQFAGSLTALVQGIEVDSIDPNMKTTGLSKRAILKGRGF